MFYKDAHYLTLDTNAWIYLANGTEPTKLLKFIQQAVESYDIVLVIPDLVIKEWYRNKEVAVEKGALKYFSDLTGSFDRILQLLGDKQKFDKDLFYWFLEDESDISSNDDSELLKDLIHKFKRRKSEFEDAVKRNVRIIEELFDFDTTVVIAPSNKIALKASRFALEKKAPFLKKNSFADAMILFTFIDYIERNYIYNSVFVSYNTDDFCERINGKSYLHPHLVPEFARSRSQFFHVIGEALNVIQEDLISMEELEVIEEMRHQFEEKSEDEKVEICKFCLEKDGTQHQVEFHSRESLSDERVSSIPGSQLALSIVKDFAKKRRFEVLHSVVVGYCTHCETEHFKCPSCDSTNSVEEDEYNCRIECATCRTPYYIDTEDIESELSEYPLGLDHYKNYSRYRLLKDRAFCQKCNREFRNLGPGVVLCEQCEDERFFEEIGLADNA